MRTNYFHFETLVIHYMRTPVESLTDLGVQCVHCVEDRDKWVLT